MIESKKNFGTNVIIGINGIIEFIKARRAQFNYCADIDKSCDSL